MTPSRRHTGILSLIVAATACATGAPTAPNTDLGRLSTRTVSVTAGDYEVTEAPAEAAGGLAGVAFTYDSRSRVVGAHGSLRYRSGASITVDIDATPLGLSGSMRVVDPAASIDRHVDGIASTATFGDDGSFDVTISDGSRRIRAAADTVPLPAGTDPALEALLAEQSDFCADAQQRLAGLDASEVPLDSIANTLETPRSAFGSAKAVVDPLTTRTWTDTIDVTLADGSHGTISQHISCKTRSADHVATTGVATASTDAQCAVLNERSINLALDRLSPAERATANIPNLGTDIVRHTGVEWTTPLDSRAEFDGSTLRAHALLVRWTDPAFALFPATIRGVHYCTVWSPAYAYWYLRQTSTEL